MKHKIIIEITGTEEGDLVNMEVSAETHEGMTEEQAQKAYKGQFKKLVSLFGEFVAVGASNINLIPGYLKGVRELHLLKLFGKDAGEYVREQLDRLEQEK